MVERVIAALAAGPGHVSASRAVLSLLPKFPPSVNFPNLPRWTLLAQAASNAIFGAPQLPYAACEK